MEDQILMAARSLVSIYTPGPRATMALEAGGMIYKVAKQLVLEYPQGKIEQIIEYADWHRN